MVRETLYAPDISCGHCIMSIEKALSKIPGVRFVSGDSESKTVVVEYDPAVAKREAIEAAMEEEGYPVKT